MASVCKDLDQPDEAQRRAVRALHATRSTAEGTRHEVMRRNNESVVLRTVLDRRLISRSEIASATGLSPATVTKIAARLIADGLLIDEVTEAQPRSVGRPTSPLALSKSRYFAVGAHIGLTATTIGLSQLDGTVEEVAVLVHHSSEPGAVLNEAATALAKLASKVGRRSIVIGVGVSLGGRVDEAQGRVADHAALGWHDIPVVQELRRKVRADIMLTQHVRGLAEAMLWFGNARHLRNFVLLFLGNIIGAAIVVDGTIVCGLNDSAGTIAHLPISGFGDVQCECGRRGCFAAVAGESSVVARYVALTTKRTRSATNALRYVDLLERFRQGDQAAAVVLQDQIRAGAAAAATAIGLLGPEQVLIAGNAGKAPELVGLLRDEMMHVLQDPSFDVARVVGTEYPGNDLVASAVTPVLRRLYMDPASVAKGRSLST